MTFSDVKKTDKTTVVFFPACLSGSLANALRKDNQTEWKIIRIKAAETDYNAKCPRDEDGHPCVRQYADMELTTDQVKALASKFDPDGILDKIYGLYEDIDAMKYQNEQAALLRKALEEDGMV